MSAAETACLVKYFGLIIGDLIPRNDEVWQIYIALRKIIEIAMSPSVDKEACSLLSTYISEHHNLYINLKGQPLTAKFHNVVHYPRLMFFFGPLALLSTARFDSEHRVAKSVSTSVACRKNICWTIGRKIQLQLSRFLTENSSRTALRVGPNEKSTRVERFLEEIEGLTLTTHYPHILTNERTIRTTWVEVKGTRYCVNETLYVAVHEETSFPIFGLIRKIFVSHSGKVYFLLRNFRTITFEGHYYAFELEIVNSYSVVGQEQLHDFHPHQSIPKIGVDLFYVSILQDS